MFALMVFVPPVRDNVTESGGACAPIGPLIAIEPLVPGVIVSALAALAVVESIAALKVIAEVAAVALKVVAIFRTTGALYV